MSARTVDVIDVTKVFEVKTYGGTVFGSREHPASFVAPLVSELLGRRVKVRKIYALRDVTFRVREGSIFCILGPNGAGKTTLLRIICGITPPTRGEVYVFGRDLFANPEYIPKTVTLLKPNMYKFALSDALTVRDNLVRYAELHGYSKDDVDRLLEFFGLREYENVKVAILSSGMKRRLDFILSFLRGTPVMLMDEPTSMLSPESTLMIHRCLREVFVRGEGRTILYATHLLRYIDELADEVMILDRGRVVEVGEPSALVRKYGLRDVIEVELRAASPEDLGRALEKLVEAGDLELLEKRAVGEGVYALKLLSSDTRGSFPRIIEVLHGLFGFKILRTSVREPTVEDVYMKVIGGGSRREA